jgi:dsDNA-binding SOS-regulon protein
MLMNQGLQALGSLLVVPMLALSAFAKEPAMPAGRTGGFQTRIEKAVGLNAEQREAVSGLLAQQREDLKTLRENHTPQYAAVQEQTDAKIRALLNPEQQKKFDAFLAKQKQARKSKPRKAS